MKAGTSRAFRHQVDEADYCNLLVGDIVVETSPLNEEVACGWGYGIIFRAGEIYPGCWFPPAYVRELSHGHIEGTGNFGEDLLSIWSKYGKFSRRV